jgi:enoyl-CoA hydratase/3-hydroxyacyl-CoA dehydrogenase
VAQVLHDVIRVEHEGPVVTLTIDHPPANAVNGDVVSGLTEGLADAEADETCRALVITGNGPKFFSAGADITAFGAGAEAIGKATDLTVRFEASRLPVIAAVNGIAFGGGCELTLACDIRIASRTARFGQPEIKLGIIPGFGGTQRLPRLVGQSKALEMNLVGDPMQATEAYEYGLANAVVDDHELLDTALAWARRLAAQAPLALEQIKRVSAAGDLDEGIEAEKRAFATVFASADAKEGIAAFLGKRAPKFEGK